MTDRREKIARLIAFWHGAKITLIRNGSHTVAAQHGYGQWGDAPERYSAAHWQEYLPAVDAVIKFMEPDYVG